MTTEREFKEKIIAAAEKAIVELILVAKEPIITVEQRQTCLPTS
jgi:hypothetical protein